MDRGRLGAISVDAWRNQKDQGADDLCLGRTQCIIPKSDGAPIQKGPCLYKEKKMKTSFDISAFRVGTLNTRDRLITEHRTPFPASRV